MVLTPVLRQTRQDEDQNWRTADYPVPLPRPVPPVRTVTRRAADYPVPLPRPVPPVRTVTRRAADYNSELSSQRIGDVVVALPDGGRRDTPELGMSLSRADEEAYYGRTRTSAAPPPDYSPDHHHPPTAAGFSESSNGGGGAGDELRRTTSWEWRCDQHHAVLGADGGCWSWLHPPLWGKLFAQCWMGLVRGARIFPRKRGGRRGGRRASRAAWRRSSAPGAGGLVPGVSYYAQSRFHARLDDDHVDHVDHSPVVSSRAGRIRAGYARLAGRIRAGRTLGQAMLDSSRPDPGTARSVEGVVARRIMLETTPAGGLNGDPPEQVRPADPPPSAEVSPVGRGGSPSSGGSSGDSINFRSPSNFPIIPWERQRNYRPSEREDSSSSSHSRSPQHQRPVISSLGIEMRTQQTDGSERSEVKVPLAGLRCHQCRVVAGGDPDPDPGGGRGPGPHSSDHLNRAEEHGGGAVRRRTTLSSEREGAPAAGGPSDPREQRNGPSRPLALPRLDRSDHRNNVFPSPPPRGSFDSLNWLLSPRAADAHGAAARWMGAPLVGSGGAARGAGRGAGAPAAGARRAPMQPVPPRPSTYYRGHAPSTSWMGGPIVRVAGTGAPPVLPAPPIRQQGRETTVRLPLF